jgi:hypothetical protein
MNEFRGVLTIQDLDHHVVRLHLDLTVSLSEESEVERIYGIFKEPMRRTGALASW